MEKEVKIIPPELAESEDERIRRAILSGLKYLETELRWDAIGDIDILDAYAWLEKQASYTFEIKAGHWYKCVCDYMLNGSDLMFKNDRLYYCRSSWRLEGELYDLNVKDIGVDGYKSFFRPATNQEIKDWLEKQGSKPQGKTALEAIREEKVDNANKVQDFKAEDWYVSKVDGKIHNICSDKAEPKFKVGDWITFNGGTPFKILKIEEELNGTLDYLLVQQDGHDSYYNKKYVDENARLWTIQDSKPGDVLVCDGKYGQEIGIVKKYIGKYGGCDKCFETYCFVDWDGIFRVGEYMGSRNIHPATKKQRNTLMKAMTDAGYEWDEVNKVLKKIING